jgi:hypothetical protein
VDKIKIHSFKEAMIKAWGNLDGMWFPIQAAQTDEVWQLDPSRKIVSVS